ncbi:peptidyl-prolyl cis-trans isomerase FKBP5-like [Thalassophryne amazonica]|uniref:peptidyl-prolyl cis-trans isomerase FKBP5-like n=1 Tax=Thalassophryne amazonica TaxID=390379 RepID=UPI0014712877|nr:peptidyl-prolyl cis-trans isomerase FKBP5-like [Thalassophryne amazonica]
MWLLHHRQRQHTSWSETKTTTCSGTSSSAEDTRVGPVHSDVTEEKNSRQLLLCEAEMSTDQDVLMDGHSATAIFAAKGIDITPNKDQGVIKVVKRRGVDGDRTMTGDRVTVHYTGRLLSGKVFDCSRDCKKPFCFSVGKGQVLKAWDIGVLSMRGERCAHYYVKQNTHMGLLEIRTKSLLTLQCCLKSRNNNKELLLQGAKVEG